LKAGVHEEGWTVEKEDKVITQWLHKHILVSDFLAMTRMTMVLAAFEISNPPSAQPSSTNQFVRKA
jgi:hypothetical protein